MYSRSNPKNVLGRFRYYIELALYRWLGWLPFISGKERDDKPLG
jgi:hypothetical protein